MQKGACFFFVKGCKCLIYFVFPFNISVVHPLNVG